MAALGRDSDAGLVQKEIDENYEGIEEKETMEDDEFPVVLQCKNCSTIVGDSTAWVCANDDLATVTLHCIASGVITGKKLMTSTTEGTDLGSTYVHLICKQCSEVVGRIYKTTSKQLDSLRDLYTFSVHQIKSYQVGSGEVTADTDLQDILDIPTAKSLKDVILKTQVMICALNNRILNIENALEIKEEPEEGTLNFVDLDDQQSRSDTGYKKQPAGQYKATGQQSDAVSVEKESSGSLLNGRKYGSGKRSKEMPSVAGARATKRSRCK